jgi:hypothetical protein
VEELYGTRYQSGSFSLIKVGNGFHCLRNFSFLFFSFDTPNAVKRKNITLTDDKTIAIGKM